MAPILILAGVLFLRGAPMGYFLASVMLFFTVTLVMSIAVFGVAQFPLGLVTIGQFIGFVVPFAVLTLVAIWYSVVVLRNLSDSTPEQAARARVGIGELK